MKYSKSSHSDLKVSRIAFGTHPFDEKYWSEISDKKAIDLMTKAYENDINYYNTAPYYGWGRCERLLGRFASKVGRGNVLIASKLGTNIEGKPFSLKPKYIEEELYKTLDRLNTDYLDVCLLHMPDENTPLEESLEKTNEFKKKKLIKHIGISNHTVEALEKAIQIADIEVLEFHYSMLTRKAQEHKGDKISKFGEKQKLIMTAYRVIERGILTDLFEVGKDSLITRVNKEFKSPFVEEKNIVKIEKLLNELKAQASDFGFTLAQLAIAWMLTRSKYTVALLGFREFVHLEEDIKVLDMNLSKEQIQKIDKIVKGYRFSI